ncbi:MAG TPA: protein kinase, partial [Kofleriaceae bacterium]
LRQWAAEARTRDEIVAVLVGAAEGIAAAHAAGLVHRDIKPENVLVTRDGRAIVTDFGLARHEDAIDPNASTLSTDPHLTATGAIAGTPAYLAPEQLLGDPIDARVDQFAFAVMAWELLTGTKPFPIIIALRVDAVRAGVTPPPTMPKHLAAALAKAMSASPRDRFATMRELIEAMETPVRGRARTKTGAPLVAHRSRGPIYASLGLLAMTGAAITAWQWPRHPHEQPPPPIIVQKTIAPPPPQPVAPPDAAVPADAPVAIAVARPPAPPPQHKPAAATPVVRKQTIPPPAPPDTTQQMTADQGSQTLAVQKRHSHSGTERRDAAIATMDAFCYLPYDVAHPDKELPRPVVDWGKVVSITPETGHLMGDEIDSNILTIKGARGTYRVMQEVGVLNYVVPAQVGDWMALCADREESDIYRFPGGPTLPVESIVPLRAPPRITELAKYKPLHIRELAMTAAGANQHHNLHEDRAYVIRAKVVDLGDGKRLKMDRYYMDVPASIKLEVGKPTWVVVDHLHYEEADDSGKKPFVVRAVAVLDGDMFPG